MTFPSTLESTADWAETYICASLTQCEISGDTNVHLVLRPDVNLTPTLSHSPLSVRYLFSSGSEMN